MTERDARWWTLGPFTLEITWTFTGHPRGWSVHLEMALPFESYMALRMGRPR